METNNILATEVGKPDDGIRDLIIEDVTVGTVTFNDGRDADKVYLHCKTVDGSREFQISEAWNETRKGKKVQGLWVQLDNEKNLASNSTLAKLLKFHNLKAPNDFKGLQVTGYPDKNGYVVLTAIDQKETSNDSIFE